MTEKKPTLMQLRRNHNYRANTDITTKQLAETSGVALADVFQMELGRPISLEDAHKVLHVFSRLVGKQIKLSDVDVIIKQETQEAHHWFDIP